MYDKFTIATAVVIAAVISVMIGPLGVAGESTGEVRLTPTETSLEDGESQKIDIIYDTQSGESPSSLEFRLEHDPEVIKVTNSKLGEHVNSRGGSDIIDPDAFRFGYLINQDQIESDEFTVATITVELEDGVDQGDKTDLTFSEVTAGTQGLETTGGSIKAIEGTPETVEITNAALSPSEINDSEMIHTLDLAVSDVSADGKDDEFTITLPSDVEVRDITKTTVTEQGTDTEVPLTNEDPANDPSPENTISFKIDPRNSDIESTDMSIKLNMKLSPAS